MMKKITRYIILVLILGSAVACSMLDSKEDLYLTDDMLATRRYQLFNMGNRVYNNVPYGFSRIDDNLFATVSDEAQYVSSVSQSARFNNGSWNQYYNPDDVYAKYFGGIFDINYFIENSRDYKYVLGRNRDTITSSGAYSYHLDITDIERFRSEAVVMRAYYYFELIKRYGGVPLIEHTYDDPYTPRSSYVAVTNKIVNDIDSVKNGIVTSWAEVNLADHDGRVTLGMALALKSRVLLYAASPLNNPNNDTELWRKAAAAANDVIALNRYSLAPDYGDLFVAAATNNSPETIWAVRYGADNSFEKENYPIGTQGGGTGICPSYNLVQAYEHNGNIDSNDFTVNIDPRYRQTIVGNLDQWNGRILEIYGGGVDDPSKPNTSRTGFYLKKFLNPDLNLTNDAKSIRSWIVFRYAEILLNYAEAMNEAYGPDAKSTFSMSARQALNLVRQRSSMPDVVAADKDEMRERIKHERQIELAFEEHRFWDLLRWKDAETVLNKPIYGIKNSPQKHNTFSQEQFVVANRTFDAAKMYLYPIPQEEIVKAAGAVDQNPNW